MTKDTFKQFAEHFRHAGNLSFHGDGITMDGEQFTKEVEKFDPILATKVRNWLASARDLSKYVEDRSEGCPPLNNQFFIRL